MRAREVGLWLGLGLGLGLGCAGERERDPEPAASDPAAAPPPPSVIAPEQPGADPRPSDDDPTDPCDPLPKDGAPCHREGSFCVIDWGQPCGASTAAWCRNGAWFYEEEANLCDGD